jgi:hypothetical protein
MVTIPRTKNTTITNSEPLSGLVVQGGEEAALFRVGTQRIHDLSENSLLSQMFTKGKRLAELIDTYMPTGFAGKLGGMCHLQQGCCWVAAGLLLVSSPSNIKLLAPRWRPVELEWCCRCRVAAGAPRRRARGLVIDSCFQKPPKKLGCTRTGAGPQTAAGALLALAACALRPLGPSARAMISSATIKPLLVAPSIESR